MMAGGLGLDPDAVAFLTAAGITDATITTAIDTLVVQLKGFGIWTKMKAIYPFVGGTATTHKFNLKDPQDTNAAFRLVFAGGWTHSATGALPNGTNAYANSYLEPSVYLSQNSSSYGFYSRTQANNEYYDMGTFGPNNSVMLSRFGGNFLASNNDGSYNPATNSSSLGLFISNRTASNVKKGYRNNVTIQSVSQLSTGLSNSPIYLGAISGYPGYSIREHAFSFIGDGLTDTEAANLYTAVQAFQTTLGRQV